MNVDAPLDPVGASNRTSDPRRTPPGHRGSAKPFLAAVLVVGMGSVTAACSSEDTGASEASGPPAVCSSADALQASMAELGDVRVVESGTAALQDAVAAVKSDLQDVVGDASSQYSSQVEGLQAGFDAVQTAAGTALNAPSADSLTAVSSSISALAADVNAFADDVASTC